MKLQKIQTVIFLCSLSAVGLAQSGTVSTGGDVTSGTGSVSYSVGQVDFINVSGTNANLNQGLQQPYEFFIIDEIGEIGLELSLNLFPNPTRDAVMLTIKGQDMNGLQFQLFDATGKLLDTQKISVPETIVRMEPYAMSTYLLKITRQNSEIKTFQIIKNF